MFGVDIRKVETAHTIVISTESILHDLPHPSCLMNPIEKQDGVRKLIKVILAHDDVAINGLDILNGDVHTNFS